MAAGNLQEELKRTPLYNAHLSLGGKMVPFAGWEMPVQYSNEGKGGVVSEHEAVRNSVGIFDVSHMGEIEVRGKDAISFLDYVTCNNPRVLKDNQAQYTAFPNEKGGIVDDVIVYRFSEEHFLLCVNASNADRDFEWLKDHKRGEVSIENLSDEFAQIAVQGPKAFQLLKKIFNAELHKEIARFYFDRREFEGEEVIIARTGYTGEDGVEVFLPASKGESLWNALLVEGEEFGIFPCGLGARDSLRLEAGYPLHGHELSDDITAIESDLGWIVKPKNKGDFIGRAVLEKEKVEGAARTLIGFFVEDKGIVREESKIFESAEGGEEVGFVTSGTKTPTVGKSTGKALGMAIIKSEIAKSAGEAGVELYAEVRGRRLRLKTTPLPFYKGEFF